MRFNTNEGTVIFDTLQKCSQDLKEIRSSERKAESAVVKTINAVISNDFPAVNLSKLLKVTPQHLSDIRHGRRGVSKVVLSRLVGLK